ncbi:MAG TPA: acetyl-CoA carboxylase biotin carboxyl carrier protein [Steroidobacteraceae bacterium]|nr:acetyl-CoA carboxylase biotin carboxyl carrier protein [Steroidobacteraceae bacterium]
MTLTAKDVAEITRLLEQSSFDELYLEIDGVKLSLKRRTGGSADTAPLDGAAPSAPVRAAAPTGAPAAAAVPAAPPAAEDPDAVSVTAPLLGTFYRAPKPGAPPFVEVGSAVQEDSIIGIIEVMKLMNTVRAGVRGRVTQILGRDGTLVEYGETLLRVSKAG